MLLLPSLYAAPRYETHEPLTNGDTIRVDSELVAASLPTSPTCIGTSLRFQQSGGEIGGAG